MMFELAKVRARKRHRASRPGAGKGLTLEQIYHCLVVEQRKLAGLLSGLEELCIALRYIFGPRGARKRPTQPTGDARHWSGARTSARTS